MRERLRDGYEEEKERDGCESIKKDRRVGCRKLLGYLGVTAQVKLLFNENVFFEREDNLERKGYVASNI